MEKYLNLQRKNCWKKTVSFGKIRSKSDLSANKSNSKIMCVLISTIEIIHEQKSRQIVF